MSRLSVVSALALSIASLVAGAARAAGPAPGPAGDPLRGQQVYVAQKCSVCHTVSETGGKIGPDLSEVGKRRTAAWMAKYLPNPTPIDPRNPPKLKMMPVQVKGKELDDLIAYLVSLKGKK